jgi:hypothetical protein
VFYINLVIKLGNELLAYDNSPPNVRETYLAFFLFSQGLYYSYNILDLELIVSLRDRRRVIRVFYLPVIKLNIN